MEAGMVAAGRQAFAAARPADAGLAVTTAIGLGTNRRDPAGPADPDVPVFVVRARGQDRLIACMLVCCMHPTVLHEDSTLVSGDFPGLARRRLQADLLGHDCPVLHHTGPSGNQSPRHVTRANTFEEAERLGRRLSEAVAAVIPRAPRLHSLPLTCLQGVTDLPCNRFPPVAETETQLAQAAHRLAALRAGGAPRQEVRTAECDWFGAEERHVLAHMQAEGRLEPYVRACLPAEMQVIAVGPWRFVAWPGEIFVEHGLALKQRAPRTCVISAANGTLQGYIVTPEAAAEGGYEASNALFAPDSGRILVEKTLDLLNRLPLSTPPD
jgi:hypothetical protein